MAQIRQPKFKVNSYKLFRKSYVLAVIQKLKPFINERYAQYLSEESKKVDTPDNTDVPQNGALLQNQMEKTDNFIATTVDPFKPFWQGRKGHVPSPNLSAMGGETNWDTTLSDSSSDSSGSSNQVMEQNSNGSKDKEVVYPIWYKASDLLVSNLSDSILDFLLPYEDDLPLAQYVVVRPAPRIGHRTEIDLTTIDRLLSRPIYLKYLTAKVISNRNESTSTIDLSDQMHLEDINRPDNNNNNNLNIIDCTPCTNMARTQRVWFPVTEKFLKFVLTYLVVFLHNWIFLRFSALRTLIYL